MMFVVFCLLVIFVCTMGAMQPVTCIANVRGKKYEVTAATVGEFSEKVESLCGISSSDQSIIFKGKVLRPTDKLNDVGIDAGDVLNVLKGRKARAPNPNLSSFSPSTNSAEKISESLPDTKNNNFGSLDDLKHFNPEQIKQSMMAMEKMLDSGLIEEYFGNNEKIESARVQLLASAEQYDKMMPGFKAQITETAADPVVWRETMLKAKDQLLKLKALRGQESLESINKQKSPSAIVPPQKASSVTLQSKTASVEAKSSNSENGEEEEEEEADEEEEDDDEEADEDEDEDGDGDGEQNK
jgi:hypothetical protein